MVKARFELMLYLDAKEAVKEMHKHGFDIVRCIDCKRSHSYGSEKLYCHKYEFYVDHNGFCPHGIHIETPKCYNCPIAQNYNLEDDDTPCLDCEDGTK